MTYWADIKFTLSEGKLVPVNKEHKLKYKLFIEGLKEGDEIETFLNKTDPEKSLAQLAKVHACIKTIAMESGYTFLEVKQLVKEYSGLSLNNENKSFADCSVQELMLAIQACIEIGYEYNLNLQ